MKPLYKLLQEPFPTGWIPKRGDTVIVPNESDGYIAYRGTVKTILGLDLWLGNEIVRVRVPAFRCATKEYLLAAIRPYPKKETTNESD